MRRIATSLSARCRVHLSLGASTNASNADIRRDAAATVSQSSLDIAAVGASLRTHAFEPVYRCPKVQMRPSLQVILTVTTHCVIMLALV